jgi:hypothetical protein
VTAISAGASTALNGNGTDTDGAIGPGEIVVVRFTQAGGGKSYGDLVGRIAAVRYSTT